MSPSPRRKVQVWIFGRSPKGERQTLIFQTQPERDSFWQPVTGSVDPGETDIDAADREAREETGCDHLPRARAVGYEFEFDCRHGERCHETVFAIDLGTAPSPKIQTDPREHQAHRWVSVDEARSTIRFETNREGLARAVAVLKTSG